MVSPRTLAASSSSSATTMACRKSERMPPSSSRSSTSPAASCMAFRFAGLLMLQAGGPAIRERESAPRKRRGLPLPACDDRRGLEGTRRLLPGKFQLKNAMRHNVAGTLTGSRGLSLEEGSWCGREESNLHEQAHSDLNAARLP